MPISSKSFHQSYFRTLTHTAPTEKKLWLELTEGVDKILQKTEIFNKVIFIKNLPFVLDQTQLTFKQFRLFKAISTLLIGFATFFLLAISADFIPFWFTPIGIGVGCFIGWCLPELYLKDRLSTHQFFLQHAVPDFLEQLHMMSASTGFESFGQALKLIAPSFPDPLGTELRKLTAIQTYLNEEELLERLVLVCPHPLLKELALSIKLSSQFGSSLSEKTAGLVATAQQQQEQRTKDLGNKTSGILLGPLLLFHLPALLLIFLIPFLFMLSDGL